MFRDMLMRPLFYCFIIMVLGPTWPTIQNNSSYYYISLEQYIQMKKWNEFLCKTLLPFLSIHLWLRFSKENNKLIRFKVTTDNIIQQFLFILDMLNFGSSSEIAKVLLWFHGVHSLANSKKKADFYGFCFVFGFVYDVQLSQLQLLKPLLSTVKIKIYNTYLQFGRATAEPFFAPFKESFGFPIRQQTQWNYRSKVRHWFLYLNTKHPVFTVVRIFILVLV